MADHLIIQFRKKIIADFFSANFNSKSNQVINVSRNNDIGRMVYSLVQYSDFPKKVNLDPSLFNVEIELPGCILSTSNYKYIYISKESMFKINDYVTAELNQQVRAFHLMSLELGIQNKNAMEFFLAAYKLNQDKHAGLIKKTYRWDVSIKKKILKLANSFDIQ